MLVRLCIVRAVFAILSSFAQVSGSAFDCVFSSMSSIIDTTEHNRDRVSGRLWLEVKWFPNETNSN